MSKNSADVEKVINKALDDTFSRENVASMMSIIDKTREQNGIVLNEKQSQFLADFALTVAKTSAKHAVVATLNASTQFERE